MVIKQKDMSENYIETESEDFERERQFNMLPGPSCEINQLYFARINLCNLSWGDIVLALKHCKKDAVWADWSDWHKHWKLRGEAHEELGLAAIDGGHGVSAREALLRAAACYHFAEFMYFDDPPDKEATRRKVTEVFEKAVPFMKHGYRPLRIPYGDIEMPGYLLAPADATGPSPCVILNNGMESAKEAELFAFAQSFADRGVAVIAFDGPGQGELLGSEGMVVAWEDVIESVLDEAESLAEVNAEQIGMFGVSFGGYLCLRGAAFHQDRVKAAINLSGCYDIDNFPMLRGMVLDDFCYVFQLPPDQMNTLAIEKLNLREVPALERPLLTIHSRLDSLFPIETAERVHEWAQGEKELMVYDHEWHVCTNHMTEFIPQFCDWMLDRLSES